MLKNLLPKLVLMAASLTILASCSEQQSKTADVAPMLSGHLYGVDGKPLQHAVIKVTPLNGNRKDNTHIINVASNGAYALENHSAFKSQRYIVNYLGAGHLAKSLVLNLGEQDNLALNVELDRLPFVTAPKHLQIKLYSNKATDKTKIKPVVYPLKATSDGSYKISLSLEAGTIKYHLGGLTRSKMNVANPQTKQFEYDLGSHFYSVDQHSGGDWTFVYNPVKYQKFKASNPIRLSGPWHEQGQSIHLQAQYNRLIDQQTAQKAQDTSREFSFTDGLTTIEQWQQQYPGKAMQQLLNVMSTTIAGQSSSAQHKVLKSVDPTQWYWNLPGASFTYSLWLAGNGGDYYTVMHQQLKTYAPQIEAFLANNGNDDEKARLLVNMADTYRHNDDLQQYQHYYRQFKAHYAHVSYFEMFNKRLAPSKLIEGLHAPEFSIAGFHHSGTTYDKDSFKGKVYLLDFWATWCAPCLKEMPILHEVYEQFKPLGFEILSLSGDDTIEDVSQFRQLKWQMPWKHAFLDNGKHPINKDYFVFGYPKAVLIDEQGNILADRDKARGSKLVKTLTDYYSKKGLL